MQLQLLAGNVDKVKRRLAQNREAARKSRQRRKAYVQNLEEEVRGPIPDPRSARSLGGSRCLGQSDSLCLNIWQLGRGVIVNVFLELTRTAFR